MIISYHFPRLTLATFFAILASTWRVADLVPTRPGQIYSTFSKNSEPTYYMKQLQLLKLFNNLNCWRDRDLEEISNDFNPLENLELYKDPELVRSYFEWRLNGEGLPRDEPFVNDKYTVAELKKIFRIHFLIDDWNLFYKTAAYSIRTVNPAMLYWALYTLVNSKFSHEHFRTPPSYEVFPQLFTPKSILYSLNGIQEIPSNLTNGNEAKLDYYRHDPSINSFHFAWHVDFPFWWKNEDYNILKDRKGEMFLYMHRQLINRYRSERISVGGLEDFTPLEIGEDLGPGYVSHVLNVNFREYPPRLNNSKLKDLPSLTVNEIKSQAELFREGVAKEFLLKGEGARKRGIHCMNTTSYAYCLIMSYLDENDKVHLENRIDTSYDIIGATAEASEDSPSQIIYGSLHNKLHRMIARLPDPDSSLGLPPGVIAHSETAVTDPVFFRIHSLIDSYYTQQSKKLKPYSQDDLILPGVELRNLRIVRVNDNSYPASTGTRSFEPAPSTLETFDEDFSFDVSNGIQSCSRLDSEEKFIATVRRWNHKPFKYHLEVNSQIPMNTTIRIFMSKVKDYDGKAFSAQKLFSNMFEMDRFTTTLTRGKNVITRLSKDSSVTVPDATPTEQLLRETREALESGRAKPYFPYGSRYERHCGYPHHMLVPKGTREGTQFKLFAILTEGEDLFEFPGLSICGVQTGKYPDRKPMGFPFDREIHFPSTPHWYKPLNYRFIDVTVKHNG